MPPKPNQLISGDSASAKMERIRKPSLDVAVPDIFRREVGLVSARKFSRRLGAPEDLVLRFEIVQRLKKHYGCVNTVSFSSEGDILASGSDDTRVILWNWQTGKVKLRFHSGHIDNIFQAKFMPFSDNRSIVMSAADGEVRHGHILDSGKVETVMLAQHEGAVHKLAIEPGSPHILYSCGEDGLVQQCDLRIKDSRELFICRKTKHGQSYGYVCLNAIAMDPRNPNLIAVAGSDEYARLYDLRSCKLDASTDFGVPVDYFCPPHLIGDVALEITGLAFSEQSELLVSYNQEFIYLFDSNMGLGSDLPAEYNSSSELEGSETSDTADVDHQSTPQLYKGHRNIRTVKGVGFYGPNCEYVVSGSDCGRIFIWKKKGGQIVRVMQGDSHVVNCIESHPRAAVLASSGIDKDIKLWTPTSLEKATIPKDVLKLVELPHRMTRTSNVLQACDGIYYCYDDSDGGDGDDDDDDDDDDAESESESESEFESEAESEFEVESDDDVANEDEGADEDDTDHENSK